MKLLLGFLLGLGLNGQNVSKPVKLYYWSMIDYATSALFDAATSTGQYESFSLARSSDGRFHARGWFVASSEVTIPLVIEHFIVKRWPRSRQVLTIFNFSLAVPHWWAGTRNLRIKDR
jgi:hypothetical protein